MLHTVTMRQKISCARFPPIPGTVLKVLLGLIIPATAASYAHAQTTASPAATDNPVAITLEEAIRRAQTNEPAFALASADSRVAALDRSIARAGMLPSVTYHNQYLYTQPNGLLNQAGQGVAAQPAPKFISNNAIREYASQAVVNETIGLAHVAGVRRADAAAALTAAQFEVARRGLVSAVTGMFYGLVAADNKLGAVHRALSGGEEFTKLP